MDVFRPLSELPAHEHFTRYRTVIKLRRDPTSNFSSQERRRGNNVSSHNPTDRNDKFEWRKKHRDIKQRRQQQRDNHALVRRDNSTAPDVLLNVPQLSVGRIELDVDNLQADINLNANVASLVKINAGVAVSITKVNITISDVDAQLELIVRLGHLVDIVQRVFQSLDLNPLLITLLNDVTQVVSSLSSHQTDVDLN